MKKKVYVTIIFAMLFATLPISKTFAAQVDDNTSVSISSEMINEVKLTDVQKKEIKQLFDKKIELQKQIVQKYVDFGVISKEQANKKLQYMEKKQQYMEKNGYIPKARKGNKHNNRGDS